MIGQPGSSAPIGSCPLPVFAAGASSETSSKPLCTFATGKRLRGERDTVDASTGVALDIAIEREQTGMADTGPERAISVKAQHGPAVLRQRVDVDAADVGEVVDR
jgi:hypothetical protein